MDMSTDTRAHPWWSYELAELPSSGPLRFSGYFLRDNVNGAAETNKFITHTGSLAWWPYTFTSLGPSSTAQRQDLVGYDANGWPVWGAPYILASQSATSQADPAGMSNCCEQWWPEPTSGGILATFRKDPSTAAINHHLGGIRLGGSTWSWRASPGGMITEPDGKGTFPDDMFTNNGLGALVEGDYIFEGYGGNNSSFSSQWMQWSQDGLLIGQFGHAVYGLFTWGLYEGQIGPAGGASDGTLFPGAAGNNGSMATASVNGDIYVYSSDESYHHGIHQFKISGLDTIHELMGSAAVGETVILQ